MFKLYNYVSQMSNFKPDTFQVCRFSNGPDQVMFKVQGLSRSVLNIIFIKYFVHCVEF